MPIPYPIKTFRGGISDEGSRGIVGSFKHGHALDIHDREDKLIAKQSMSTVLDASTGVFGSGAAGSTMTGIVNVFLPTSDGSTLAFTDRGSIWCRSGDQQWQFVYNDPNGAITGAAEWEDDNRNNYIVWATSTAIARKLYPGTFSTAPDTGNNRWTDATHDWKVENVLTRPDNSNWHTMKQANGAMYIANRESLAEIDFTSFTWDPLTLNIRPGNTTKCLEERDDLIIVGSTREDQSEEGHLWKWISTVTNWLGKKKIPIKGINALIDTEYPLAQGGSDGEIFYSDLKTVVPINRVQSGGHVNPSGVTTDNDLAMFGFYGTDYPGIWSYGRRNKNRNPAFSYEYRLAKTVGGSTISTIGAIANINGVLMASWGTTDGSTSEYGIDQVNTTTKANALYEGLEFDGGAPYLLKKFNQVMLTMKPLPSGTSVSVKYRVNKQSTWEYAVTGGTSTTFTETDATNAEFIIGDVGYVFEIGVELNSSSNSSPEVLSINTWLDDMKYEHGGINYPSL